MKESEMIDKYLEIMRKLTKLCNMRVMVILVILGTFGTVTNGLVERLE